MHRCRAWPRRLFLALLWLPPLGVSVNAAAAEGDVVDVVVGGSVTHDSNLFRLPGFVDPNAVLGRSTKSDTITSTHLGLRVDKPYAQQRFQLDLTGTMHRYDNFSHLDYNAFDYRGAWLWHLTPRLSGSLGAARTQTLVPFEDFVVLSQQRNVRDNENQHFNVDWSAGGGWHLLGGVSRYRQSSEAPFLAEADFSLLDYEAGVRHEFASGNAVTFIQHVRHGDYVNRVADPVNVLDSTFRENESEMRLKWRIGGNSVLDGRVGWRDRNHDNFPARDFSGLVGELGYHWTPAGKLRFYLSLKRDIDAVVDVASSYRTNNTISFTPAWQLTEKTRLSLRFDRIESDFDGAVASLPGPLRRDRLHSVRLAADWMPRRNISLSTGLQTAERSSNTPTAEFDNSTVYLRAGLRF
ncbi:MAG: putative exosortase B-associated extracellular polysaccharide biosynthesis transporter EpsL [Burkholderiales bacterium]|nr:putative exosortase B-associated extracellular polysaccharide biosynthesis transporter EpsL [Burkholderiales bacterium]